MEKKWSGMESIILLQDADEKKSPSFRMGQYYSKILF